ncbi:melanoma inhibitory activity protein 3-like isoform X3 [Sinocyclocheilus grahami]|uniref:melanoma inhibitory activity protein 3-like isoform X3 n=1 Tax=Sinocyclocheilus grahami TaxID=75366 RepID=UPI0007AD0137|nr:PREDICTED: melanoma inhibitory activity protein 3-like isoform X3 [Sinocyclocheilus grahami]
MAAVHAVILFHIVFSFLHQGLGLISDYKLCGDPECESMISRVQAQRDYSAKDCRFLNFKKGDIITVYYKLTGKRNDLWAGSIEKLSGLFPKDAIKVDQPFIDEKKEIQVPTQEYDFICFDENGLVIERSTEFDDLEDLSQETDFNEVQDNPTETEESKPSQISVQDVSDQNSPKTTQKDGSSWKGSAVSGWFGRNEQSNDEPQDESSKESFKSRKIVMDMEENHVEEKTNSGTFGWIRGELTNAFGFGNKDLKTDTRDNIKNPTNDEDTSSQRSSSWISMGRDVLGFGEDNTEAATKPEAGKADENTNTEDQSIFNPSQNMDVVDNKQRDENNPDDSVENKDGPLEDRRTENEKEEEQVGWYGNMYNRITNLYREEQTKHYEDDGGSLTESHGSTSNTENIETKDSESSSQSIFSVNGLTSMLKLPFQADTVVKREEEKTEKEEDAGKEDFDEDQHNNKDQEEKMLIDIYEQDSNPTDTDVLMETQSLSDKTMTLKDSIASDSIEQLDVESNMTENSMISQIRETESEDNLNEEVKSENNADFFEGKVEQDTRDVQNDEEKTGKKEDPGKENFDQEQNNNKDQEDKMPTDIYEQDTNPTDIGVLSETQSLSDKTMTLKDSIASDSIEQLDVESNMTEDSTDSQILEIKSADNLNDEVKSENNADVSEGAVEKDMKDVQSDKEKTVKEINSGKGDFLEQQNVKDDEISDVVKQESTTKDIDLLSETQAISDGTMTLKDSAASDDIRDIDGFSKDSNTQHGDEVKSANNTTDEGIQSKNNLTDSADDILEGKLIQSLSDQDNLDSIRQQENDSNKISTDPVTVADPSELSESDIQTDPELRYENTQELNVADLYTDSHIKTVTTGQSINADKNSEPTVDTLSEYNNEKQLAEGDQGISQENYELVIDTKDKLVMERNEEQLDEELPKDITFYEEKLSDSEAHATQMSNEHKLDTNINPLNERSSHNHTLVTDELTVPSEENLHSDLESNSALNGTDYEMDNNSELHLESLVIENSGISIVKNTDSVGENDNEVVVQEEQEESGTVSETTENYFETKDDTQITNESLTQETHTKRPSLNMSDGSVDLKDFGHDLSLPENADSDNIPNAVAEEDPDGYTTSTETMMNDFFSKNDSVQDGNINIMHDQNQSVEHKEETDTANNEDHQTDSESVTGREESDIGAIWDQSDDGDMPVKSEDKEEQGNEKQPGSPEIQDKNTGNHLTETSKGYTNLYPYLSEQNIEDLLDLFGDQTLSWLDSKMGNTNAGQDNDDLDELGDFEQLLENHMKMNTKLGHIQQDNGSPGKDNTKEYQALQKLYTLLSSLRKKYSPVITDNSVERPGISEDDCVHEACLDVNKNTEISTTEAENNQVTDDRSGINNLGNPQNEPVSEEKDLLVNRANVEGVQTVEQEKRKQNTEDWTSSETKKAFQNHGLISEEHVESQNEGGQFYQMAVFVDVTMNEIASLVDKVVSSLPDDIRPGADLYGLPWEAVVFTGFLGVLTLLLFSCRFIQSIRSRIYASKETQMVQKVAELLDEKCKVLETFSEVKQKFDKLESTLQNNGMSAQAAEKDSLEVASQKFEQSNAQMKKEIERLQEELSQQNKARKQQEDQLAELEQILRNLEEEAKERKSQLEQDNTTLKIHEINTERLQKNLQVAKEEHAMLLESKEQLVQEAEDWGERLGELEEEMKMCERSHTGMLEDCANKDDRIKSLTECLLKMRDWDSEDESCIDGSTNAAGAENGDSSDFHQKQKVQKLIEAAKMSADLKSMEEHKNRVLAKLADEIKAKEDLQEGIKQLEEQKEVLESESASYASESQKLQQKLQIVTEMYQENELKLHRMLTVEEKERLQKEEKLNKAGKKISLAAEELNTYRQRARDLEEELERTSLAYKNQITSHEKKAHDNWLAARAADRDLTDVTRENAHLRQKLTGAQFKFEILEKDVREGRPLFRGERSPYGSSLSRPSSETRAFLSPPTLMDGPPRLSPQFMGPGRASRGRVEPPSGGPDSDSGSLSPSWDRERRGPPPPPDPGLPFRRPPPGPYPMGPLPPRPSLPPEPYFGDKSDSSFLRNSSSISENESREGPHSMPGDMRLPPDPDSRMGPPPGPRFIGMPPLMDPRDPHFPPRGPYGPPEFFPPRGPGGPPIGMRGPLPPGMFPRVPMPLPQHMGYLPPRHSSASFPPGPPPRPSPPGSEQPPDQSPSPHDVI